MAILLSLIYWSVGYGEWLARREDNPRGVEAELRVRRGTIFDTNQVVLAETKGEGRVTRTYHPDSGAAVGYYRFRFGSAGIEEAYSAELSGDSADFAHQLQRTIFHQPQIGQDVRLTIDVRWQAIVSEVMGDAHGAVIVLSADSSAIRVLGSYPTYSANAPDEAFAKLSKDPNSPLLNRATQGLYQPGLVLLPFWVAWQLEQKGIDWDERVADIKYVVQAEGLQLHCLSTPQSSSWAEVVAAGCPYPVARQGEKIALSQLYQFYRDWGWDGRVEPFVLPSADLPTRPIGNPSLALLGQDQLIVTPLHIALSWNTLVQGGNWRPPRLVEAVQKPAGKEEWRLYTPQKDVHTVVSNLDSNRVLDALKQEGRWEYTAMAFGGGDTGPVAWYLAAFPSANPSITVVVVLEEGTKEKVETIGRTILTRLTNPSND